MTTMEATRDRKRASAADQRRAKMVRKSRRPTFLHSLQARLTGTLL